MLSLSRISQLEESKSRLRIPRYLFRVYSSDGSQGLNSPALFASEATVRSMDHGSLYDIPEREAKRVLEDHLLWRNVSGDEFISWTSSLLWALQHAIRKQDHCGQQNTSICMLDTSHLSQVCIYPATTLLRVYNIPSQGKLRHEYYRAEYLAHGTVRCGDDQAVTIPLRTLIDRGLFELLPELDDAESKKLLHNRVVQLQVMLFAQSSMISAQEIAIAKRLACSFGGHPWTLPAMLAFLSLRKRYLRNETLLREVREHFNAVSLSRDYVPCNSMPGIADPPEIAEFWELIDDICLDREQRGWQLLSADEAGNSVELNELLGGLSLGNTTPTLAPSMGTCVQSDSYNPYDGDWDPSDEESGVWFDEEFQDEFSHDTDDEVEEANRNDDIIRLIEGD